MSSSIARMAINQPLYTWMLISACLVGGLYGFNTIGRLEDPAFPLRTAYVITPYPGATAVEVEQEVTDVIESALQELPYLDHLQSKSVPGRSEIRVEILETFPIDRSQQIWDELRRKVTEAGQRLPPGAGPSLVEDDFSDVYGLLYAVHTPGYSPADTADMARTLTTELKQVDGVARVSVAGLPEEAVYIELDNEHLVRLGLPVDAVFSAIGSENRVHQAGSVAYGSRRLRIQPPPVFDSIDAVGDLRIGRPGSTEILHLSDVAAISRAPVEAPTHLTYHNNERVFTVGVSVTPGRNVVAAGLQVDQRLSELLQRLPVGVSVSPVYRQHEVVEAAITEFLKNLLLSVATVIGALCLFMGWRMGAAVGSVLLLTVLGTVGIMAYLGIELQRISLGALMIAMGMLVDNAIVVAEGMLIGVQRGQQPVAAAEASVASTQFPLLGATVIGILAFAPIGLTEDATGQFLRSLFQVVGISLLLSWLLAITVVPLLGNRLLRSQQGASAAAADPYSGRVYEYYRSLISACLRRPSATVLGIAAVVAACLYGFGHLKQAFFPTTNAPLFYVDYTLPQGTDILATREHAQRVDAALQTLPGVVAVTASIGRGTERFTTTLNPEQPNPAYAFFVVRVADVQTMNDVMRQARARLRGTAPEAEVVVRRNEFSPGGTAKIELRIVGKDPEVLRSIAEDVMAIYVEQDLIERRLDWRQRELQLVPEFDDTQARLSGVSRNDVYTALAYATQGVTVGLFRDNHHLLPIIARAPEAERTSVQGLSDRLVWSVNEQAHIPLSRVVPAIELSATDTIVQRRNRLRTLSVQANPAPGENASAALAAIMPEVAALPLPAGYRVEWGGEHESNERARASLGSKLPATFGLMLLTTVLMFGRMRQTLVVWFTVPLIVCGVVITLLLSGLPFTFVASLGLLSLAGMVVKNCIVLVDELDKRSAEQGRSIHTIAEASVSRLRPVLLASGTTIAGMSPLLGDAFFLEMAVCIMGGLAFSTLLTLLAAPVFYRIAFDRDLQSGTPATGARSTADRPEPAAGA